MVRAAGLGKRFGRNWIFRCVEFELSKGECMAVTGANGSGKSTLLRILADLESATEGSCDVPASRGFLSPELSLYPTLTAIEHLVLAADLQGVSADYDLALHRVGLTFATNRAAGKFSTGMRTRLKVAIALLAAPELLLLDEPGSNLDDEGKLILEGIIQEQRTRGVVILATNDSREVRYSDLELRLA